MIVPWGQEVKNWQKACINGDELCGADGKTQSLFNLAVKAAKTRFFKISKQPAVLNRVSAGRIIFVQCQTQPARNLK